MSNILDYHVVVDIMFLVVVILICILFMMVVFMDIILDLLNCILFMMVAIILICILFMIVVFMDVILDRLICILFMMVVVILICILFMMVVFIDVILDRLICILFMMAVYINIRKHQLCLLNLLYRLNFLVPCIRVRIVLVQPPCVLILLYTLITRVQNPFMVLCLTSVGGASLPPDLASDAHLHYVTDHPSVAELAYVTDGSHQDHHLSRHAHHH
ncbi:unnamed protein product [Linum tenue]|uniref:NADH dehydrogenase subunit 6 n=1 Tax=Linum tenue TaxID=586396 RepID=A0AAV0NAH8_9ROSI|nr:unnamed protein product [Linum tenue]